MWTKVQKRAGKYSPSPGPVLKEAGVIINGNNEVANILGEKFAVIAGHSSYTDAFVQYKERQQHRQIQFRTKKQNSYNRIIFCEYQHDKISMRV